MSEKTPKHAIASDFNAPGMALKILRPFLAMRRCRTEEIYLHINHLNTD